MREILFRGKRTDNDEWVYGGYIFDYGKHIYYIVANIVGADNAGFMPTRQAYSLDFIEVIPETVGQYTGSTDKNGKKIFEGDIVSGYGTYIGRKVKATVAYEYGGFWIKTDKDAGVPLSSWVDTTNICEVIGNIHDNPELLEENNA